MRIKALTGFSHGSLVTLKKDEEADVADAVGKTLVDRRVAEKVEPAAEAVVEQPVVEPPVEETAKPKK